MMIARRSAAMNEQQPWEFTCKTCGGHKLTVYRVWSILAGPESETWQEWGPLEIDHTWKFKFKEIVKKDKDDEVERGDYSEFAENNSVSKPEEYEIFESEENPGNDKYYVNCASCDREIEFGWALPERRGGIFPTECSDFVPSECWPEPRYLDSWQKKGWLRR
jgi:hypothetical protein